MNSIQTESFARVIDDYCFVLECIDDAGAPLHQQTLSPDIFNRAVQATLFDLFRRDMLDHYLHGRDDARIEPRFAEGADPSRIEGFRVVVPALDRDAGSRDFPLSFFRSRATALRSELLRSGKLTEEQRLLYHVAAYPNTAPASPPRGAGMTLDPPAAQFRVHRVRRSVLGPADSWDTRFEGELPVLMHRGLLDDVVAEAGAAPDREIGGLLLGKLCRDLDSGELFVTTSCAVSGGETIQSTGASVTFTPESFAKAREMLRLRANGGEPESIVGWYHSHPFRFCQACPLPTPPECISKILFFSADDDQVMESTFDQPFMVGLLAGVEPRLEHALGHLPVRLFGWRNGEIHARGFEVIE